MTTAPQGNQTLVPAPARGSMISIVADGKTYRLTFAVPVIPGRHPAIVLIHSFNGLEPGYKDMVNQMADDGFVVIAPEWQTYGQRAGDPEVEAVIRSSVDTLKAREGCRCIKDRDYRLLRRGTVYDAFPPAGNRLKSRGCFLWLPLFTG